jgi:sugar phosphate isomerase/epimerase
MDSNAFFAMDTATRDENHQTTEAQLKLIKELGFAGWGMHDTLDVAEVLRMMDPLGLKLFTIYVGIDLDKPDSPWSPKLPAALKDLKGRDTVIWLFVIGRKHALASEEGDAVAVKAIRDVAAMAKESGVAVSLYPHYGFYVSSVRDALRLVRKVDRANVGLTFNLCHWLRADRGKDLDGLLRDVRPYLQIVTINGADKEGDWDRLIQPLGNGNYDVYGFLAQLRAVGFRGPIGLQGYGIKGDVREHLKQAMKTWREYGERLSREKPKLGKTETPK